VLINPLQALHPNKAAPGDSSLVDSSRRAHFDRAAYTAWLKNCARSAPSAASC
jgi:glutamate-1-semialdehyde 2,1-aminomutase